VLRVVRLDEKSRQASAAKLLLIAFDPEMKRVPSREVLQQAFDLTRAEADVAIGILSGKTLAEIASVRDIKVGTVRAHSKVVFQKTRTRGQADLMGLLSRFAFMAPEAARAVTAVTQTPGYSEPAPRLVGSGNQY
jgi:DNA-binding CsgD family transcriptional regulator